MINRKKNSLIEILQFLSIDIIAGSLSIGFLAIKLLNVPANPYWWIILPLSVWVVYSLDHIIDGFKKGDKAIIPRHKFHYTYRKSIIAIMLVAGTVSLTLSLLYLEKQIIYYGVIISGIIIIYFILIYFTSNRKTILFQKELIIALIYVSGIFLAPLIWYGGLPSSPILLIILSIFLLAWLEGIMISWFDYEDDIVDGHRSFTTIFGKQTTQRFLIFGHMLIELSTIISLIIIPFGIIFYAFLIILIMNAFLGILILFPDSKLCMKYHKLVGETVFILPALIIFF